MHVLGILKWAPAQIVLKPEPQILDTEPYELQTQNAKSHTLYPHSEFQTLNLYPRSARNPIPWMPGAFDAVAKLPADAPPARVRQALSSELSDFVVPRLGNPKRAHGDLWV